MNTGFMSKVQFDRAFEDSPNKNAIPLFQESTLLKHDGISEDREERSKGVK